MSDNRTLSRNLFGFFCKTCNTDFSVIHNNTSDDAIAVCPFCATPVTDGISKENQS